MLQIVVYNPCFNSLPVSAWCAVQQRPLLLMWHCCPAAKKLEQAEKKLTAASAAEADLKVSTLSPCRPLQSTLSVWLLSHIVPCALHRD